ncbi:hypothetical protein FRB95_001576 [Tulasnella sp. JGI-2019a]|nr:hypothetical protein FRB95_001576 [Tulasnella sp. JGI-2019a]
MTSQTAVALVSPRTLGAINVLISTLNASEVLIKVQYALFGAADGHAVADQGYVYAYPQVLGSTCVGIVLEVGDDVKHLAKGDVVGTFTQPGADRATQQFVVAPGCRVSKIPENQSIRPVNVAAMLSSFVTAWWTLSDSLKLPLPARFPAEGIPVKIDYDTNTPVLIWGAGTASGQFTTQLFKLSGFTNIIGVASSRSAAAAFERGATHVVNYNDADVADQIKRLAPDTANPIRLAVDTVATTHSLRKMSKFVTEAGSRVAVLMPFKPAAGGQDTGHINEGGGAKFVLEIPQEHNPFSKQVEVVPVYTYRWESNTDLKENLLVNVFPELIRRGLIQSQPVRLFKDGSLTERVQNAATLVQKNELKGDRAVIDFSV